VKKITALLACLIFSVGFLWAQMSEDQIIKMVQDAQKQGMSQQQIALMLAQKGVTKEQILKLKNAYKSEDASAATFTDETQNSRSRKVAVKNENTVQKQEKTATKEKTPKDLMDKRYLKQMPLEETEILDVETESSLSILDSLYMQLEINKRLEELLKEKEKQVFGREIFNNNLLTFEPLLNIATPDNYILGPGDEVIIDIWGASQNNIRQEISPDGDVIIEHYGPVHLSGLSVKEANARIKNELGRIYSGIASGNTSVKLTLGNIRSIQVNVMGEVLMPGTYTLPSLASVFHALYNAGGVSPIGSLRTIKVFRNGREVAEVDIYAYIMEGKNDLNILLQDGDVVIVSPYENLVQLEGRVKRPMFYEMKDNERVSDLLDYAGGFTGDAYKKNIRVIRKSGRERQVYNVDQPDFGLFSLTDGDLVTVDSVLDRFENKVEILGAVYREGLYALGTTVETVKQLIEKADGVRGDAFLNRAVLYREKPDLSLESMSVDVAGLLNGTTEDVALRKNDVLYIPSIFELREEYTITIKGAIGYPGTYKYVENMTLEDVVIQAGGLLEAASTVKVDVARRIKDPKSTVLGDKRAETFTFALKDGLIVSGPSDFTLQPFDEVYIRTSPGYQEQRDVFVEGEVMFGGEYALARKGERLSDLINKAGGLTQEAYAPGARLMRKATPEEKERTQQALLKLARQSGRDSINPEELKLDDYYPVGINLELALQYKGSDYDVILKEGDKLIVPEYSGTVRINGAVMYPNTVVYEPKAKLSYYINQAGGYAQRAKKSKAFVINMNGTVAVAKGGRLKIMPGSEIIVPSKQLRRGLGFTEIMSLASSTTSMAAMITSIINSSK